MRSGCLPTGEAAVKNRDDASCLTTVRWSHALFVDEADRVRYDWHPFVTSVIPFPHVHIDDAKAHLPPGPILLGDVLVASLEYGALPISADCRSRLNDARTAFEATAEWGCQ